MLDTIQTKGPVSCPWCFEEIEYFLVHNNYSEFFCPHCFHSFYREEVENLISKKLLNADEDE